METENRFRFMYRKVGFCLFCFFFKFQSFFMCNKYWCCTKRTKECVYVFLTHESASAVCVCENSRREEMSTRSEWSFRTSQVLFQDFAVLALALALVQSLVLLDTSHRLVLPLWAEQNPCGSWDTGTGIRSCRRPAASCCPAGRSLLGNLQAIEEPDWEVLAGSAPPWRRCWTGRRWHGTSWRVGGGHSSLSLSLAPRWAELHRWGQPRVRWTWHRPAHCLGSGSEILLGSGWHGTGGAPHRGWWLGRCSSRWLDPVIIEKTVSFSALFFVPYIGSDDNVLSSKDTSALYMYMKL